MATKSILWEQILSTGKDQPYERFISARWPLGVLKTMSKSWNAQGDGEVGVSYEISATESEPYGIVAKLLRVERPSLLAIISKHVPAAEGQGATKTVYLARLAAGKLVESCGRLYELDDQAAATEAMSWTPPTMTPAEAAQDMEVALADAHFTQSG